MPDFAAPTFEKLLDFAVFDRGGGCCRQGTSQQPTPRSRFTCFSWHSGGLLTCRLAPNVRQAVAGGVEVGGIFAVLENYLSQTAIPGITATETSGKM